MTDGIILGDAPDPFRPEGLAVARGGHGIILVSDDGDRMIGQQRCKNIRPRRDGRFRVMRLHLD